MRELFTSENLGMSPSWVKSENELGSLTLIPVDTVVIAKLSSYLASPAGRVKRASKPMRQGIVADASRTGAGREVSRQQSPHYRRGTGRWL